MNTEQIIKALECCSRQYEDNTSDECLDCIYHNLGCNCVLQAITDALALIKELTEKIVQLISQVDCDKAEIKLLQKHIESLAETIESQEQEINMNAYGLTAKRLGEENERLHASCTELTQECKKWQRRMKIECDYTKADTVRKMQERLKEHLDDFYNSGEDALLDVPDLIDQIAKEVLEGV